MIPLLLNYLPAGTVKLRGPLGRALDKVIAARLRKLDPVQLVEPFRLRNESDDRWRCEFWGKEMRSAVYAWRATGDAGLKAMLDATVMDLISTQTADGCISSYPAEKQLWGWDVWGRKYAMLGLLAYSQEVENKKEILAALVRMAEHIAAQAPRIQDCGEHFGLAPASMLRALVEIYELSGSKVALSAATQLVDNGCCYLHNIFSLASIGIPPAELSDGKAYEMNSCFQGLAAYYRLDGDEDKLKALLKYYQMTRDREIFITGGGSLKDNNGEFWFNGKQRQIRHDCGGMGETCTTVSWIALCKAILMLTADSTVADEMERSCYNALLGAMKPDGTGFTHINPFLDGGWKKAAPGTQMKDFPGHDCCLAQGPYGLSMAPLFAVMASPEGYAVNFYEDMTVEGVMELSGNYPAGDDVTITLLRSGDFELALRIPLEFDCMVEGRPASRGSYLRIRRSWKKGDQLHLHFDFAARAVKNGGKAAYVSGPLVLCREKARPAGAAAPLRQADGRVDYATAGAAFSPENMLWVWE